MDRSFVGFTRTAMLIGILTAFVQPQLSAGDASHSLKELCNLSSDIVHVRVVSKESFKDERYNRIFTKVRLGVMNAFKGKLGVSEEITLTMIGGTVDGISTLLVGSPSFRVDDEAICLLSKIRMTTGETNYVVSGLAEGKFNLSKDRLSVVRDGIDSPLRTESGHDPLPISSTQSMNLVQFIEHIEEYSK